MINKLEILSLNHKLTTLIKDDPVRPEIPINDRINYNSEVAVLTDKDSNPLAVICIKYLNFVPITTKELMIPAVNQHIAIFYTVWSYQAGSGREIITEIKSYIESNKPQIKRFITLSPKTEMAKKFHLKNGAIILQENKTSVNYEYL